MALTVRCDLHGNILVFMALFRVYLEHIAHL